MAIPLGRVHSIETCGTVDGPGIRFVAFFQGCPLRCRFCHNPDTWSKEGGAVYTAQSLFQEALAYQAFMKFSGGGVTATGGEPLLQAEFVAEWFRLCRGQGIHTALDTSGYGLGAGAISLIEQTDLVLLDMKSYHPQRHQQITGVDLQPVLDFLTYLGKHNKPVWIRYVLVPGLNDQQEELEALARFLATQKQVEKIQVLPFHQMGAYKWARLGVPYSLSETPEAGEEACQAVRALFQQDNDKILVE